MKYLLHTNCLLLATALLILTGCNAHVFSPPANIAPMESTHVSDAGTTRLAGYVSNPKIEFGPRGTTLSARARHGLGHNLELGLDAHFVDFDTDSALHDDLNAKIGIARLAGKWSPLGNYFALTAGIGAGTHTAGQFIAPDLGIILAIENPYLIPFANISGFLSQPLNEKPVDLTHRNQNPGESIQTPALTWGATWSLGLKLPLTHATGMPIAPYLGVTGTRLWDEKDNTHILGFTTGIDIEL